MFESARDRPGQTGHHMPAIRSSARSAGLSARVGVGASVGMGVAVEVGVALGVSVGDIEACCWVQAT